MSKSKCNDATASEDWVTIFIHSKGIETVPKKVEGKTRQFVRGAINLEPFEVECDRHVDVLPHVAEVLQPLINR